MAYNNHPPNPKPATINAIHDAVVEHFLTYGIGGDAKEIARMAGVSPATVRRVCGHGQVPGVGMAEEYRTSYSTNYPGMEAGTHKVWVYEPTRLELVRIINDLREQQGVA